MMLAQLHGAAHSFVSAAQELVLPHLVVATILSAGLLLASFLARDPRLMRYLALGAVLVFLVPLPNAMPERGVQLLQFGELVFSEVEIAAPAAAGAARTPHIDPGFAVSAVWLLGALLLLVRASARMRATVSDGIALPRRWRESLEVPEDVTVLVSPTSDGAHVSGLIRAVVVLPKSLLDRASEAELRAVLLHEIGHVRRRDNFWRAVSALATTIFWFHPLSWIAALRFRATSETACDAGVLDAGVALPVYLESLRRMSGSEEWAGAAFAGGSLKERIRMMKSSNVRLTTTALRVLVLTTVLLVTGTGLTLRAMVDGDRTETVTRDGSSDAAGYRLEYDDAVPHGDGELLAEFVVIDTGAGRVVASPGVRFRRGEPTMVGVTGRGGQAISIHLEPLGERELTAILQVPQEGFERSYRVGISDEQRRPAQPISLALRDVRLLDVLERFANHLDADLIVTTEIGNPRVTISFQSVPWDEALASLAREHDLQWRKVGSVLMVAAGSTSTPEQIEWPGFGTVYTIGEHSRVAPPTVISRVDPVPTREAREARVSGIVIVRALVDETGGVRDVEIVKPLPFGLSDSAADAVRQWRFAPATLDGVPVPMVFHLTVQFNLGE
jgi:TonB family protein